MKSRYKRITIDGVSYLEHRYIVEQNIGRKLLSTEQVHHINGDRFDNRISNLMVVTQEEHDRFHKWKYPEEKECVVCGKIYKPKPTKRERSKVCSIECKKILDIINASKRKKPILQIEPKSGIILNVWDSSRDASDSEGYNESNICKCLKGKIKTAYGYCWKYAKALKEVENG